MYSKQEFENDMQDFIKEHEIDYPILNEMLFKEVVDKKIWNLTHALLNYREVLKESVLKIKRKDNEDNNDLVVVIGGNVEHRAKTELLDLSGRNRLCDLSDDVDRNRFGGVVFEDKIILCGGDSENCLYGDDINDLEKSQTRILSSIRKSSSVIALNSSTIWVVGGQRTNSGHYHDTTEFVYKASKKTVKGPKLPFQATFHCMVDLKNGSFLLIGGKQNGFTSAQTWILKPSKNIEFMEGPTLSAMRYHHSCVTMTDNFGHMVIVVAGGYNENRFSIDSVELLNTTRMQNWETGKYRLGC